MLCSVHCTAQHCGCVLLPLCMLHWWKLGFRPIGSMNLKTHAPSRTSICYFRLFFIQYTEFCDFFLKAKFYNFVHFMSKAKNTNVRCKLFHYQCIHGDSKYYFTTSIISVNYNIIIIISGFGIYGAAVVPDSGVGNTWLRLTLVLHEFLSNGLTPSRLHIVISFLTHADHVFLGLPWFLVPGTPNRVMELMHRRIEIAEGMLAHTAETVHQ